MSEVDTRRTETIRDLNDKLRIHNIGGRMMITQGVQALSAEDLHAVLKSVRDFNDFNERNDPYGEHDCAAIEVAGHRIFFKIDYYDIMTKYGSPDPADPDVTTRVMTIMLTDEY